MRKLLLRKKLKFLAVFVTAAFQLAMSLAPASAALSEAGPVDPTKGFPNWYRDANGLTLDLMEAADPNGISAPVEPGNQFSQTIGFGAEGFWWSADADMQTAAGNAILVQALEAAFAGESAIDGEQSAFARIRIRIDTPETGTYTVTYPFGQKTFNVTAVGNGFEINDTNDVGCFAQAGVFSCNQPTAPNFGSALVGEIGPFLTWDTFDPNPALSDPLLNSTTTGRRYVGTVLTGPHAIKGSPTGNNVFRVEGPNIGGPGVNSIETNLFTVTGRLAVVSPTVTVDTQTATTATPTITGTVSDPAATVSVAVGTQPAINATVTGNTWSATVATPLANGTYEVAATATNAGGTATDTTTNELTINTTAALAVTVDTQTATTATPTITGTVSDPAATVSVAIETQPAINATVTGNTWSATVATPLANGTYEVAATATAGTATAIDTTANELTVNVAIPETLAVSNVQVKDITDDGATVSWTTNIPSTGSVSHGTSSTLRRSTTVNDPATGTNHSVTLTGLGSSRTIYVRVNAAAGTQTTQSNIQKFKTLRRGTAPAAIEVSNIQVTNITQTGATISWTTSVPTTGSVDVARSASMRGSTSTSDATSATTHSVNVTGLEAGRTHFFKINASDGTISVSTPKAERFRTSR